MNNKEMEQWIIDNYRRDEETMVIVFAQWCVNNELDANQLYALAYPQQGENDALQNALAVTVPREEAGDIDDETVLAVLALFGNEELAYIVTEEISKREARKRRS